MRMTLNYPVSQDALDVIEKVSAGGFELRVDADGSVWLRCVDANLDDITQKVVAEHLTALIDLHQAGVVAASWMIANAARNGVH